jgi:hypothetical protein
LSHATALAICWLGDPAVNEPPELGTVRTRQQAENNFLLYQRRQALNQRRLTHQLDEPDQRIQQVSI